MTDFWIEAEHHVSLTLSDPAQLKKLADELRALLTEHGDLANKVYRNTTGLLNVLEQLGF